MKDKTFKIRNSHGEVVEFRVPRMFSFKKAYSKLLKNYTKTIRELRSFLIQVMEESGIVLPENNVSLSDIRVDDTGYYFEIFSSLDEGTMMMKVSINEWGECKIQFLKYFFDPEERKKEHKFKINDDYIQKVSQIFYLEQSFRPIDTIISLAGEITKFFQLEIDRVAITSNYN
ncbi:MAG: hypothetical protein V4439_02410 [Patescibacteria group bacterium]